MVGGLYENKISRVLLSPSIPYFQDDITWCVATSTLAPTWKNVFVIFDSTMWITTFFILFVTTVVLHFYTKFENKYQDNILWTLLNTLRFTLAQYAHYWPEKFFIKVFLASFMFYGLHINAAYSSSLIKVLTKPVYEAQISNIDRAIQEKMRFKGGENIKVFFEKEDQVKKLFENFPFNFASLF